jgi:spore maturation protein A
MLNYIWAGLIIFSLVFALAYDAREMRRDTYRNQQPLPVTLVFPQDYDPDAAAQPVHIAIDPDRYQEHYDTDERPAASYPATLNRIDETLQVRFARGQDFPEPLASIRQFHAGDDRELAAEVTRMAVAEDGASARATITFAPVRFVKLRDIQAAAFDLARTAVTFSIGLVGVLALWLGLMQIAQASGLINILVKITQPLLRPLFPQIPRDHPALGMIALNLTANMLGLGNAATPLGIKAMEELQKLNPTDDTATDPMVMLLALNTASVQLLPPATLVAIMGIGVAELFIPILIVTFCSGLIAIVTTKLLGRLRMYRRTDPALLAASATTQPEDRP